MLYSHQHGTKDTLGVDRMLNKSEEGGEMVQAKSSQSQFNRRLLSLKELVHEYGGTIWYWRSAIWRRELPVVRVMRKQLVDTLDVEHFITRHKTVA